MNQTSQLEGGRNQAQLLLLSVGCTPLQDVGPPGLAAAPCLPLQDVGRFSLQRMVDVLLQIVHRFRVEPLQERQRLGGCWNVRGRKKQVEKGRKKKRVRVANSRGRSVTKGLRQRRQHILYIYFHSLRFSKVKTMREKQERLRVSGARLTLSPRPCRAPQRRCRFCSWCTSSRSWRFSSISPCTPSSSSSSSSSSS